MGGRMKNHEIYGKFFWNDTIFNWPWTRRKRNRIIGVTRKNLEASLNKRELQRFCLRIQIIHGVKIEAIARFDYIQDWTCIWRLLHLIQFINHYEATICNVSGAQLFFYTVYILYLIFHDMYEGWGNQTYNAI